MAMPTSAEMMLFDADLMLASRVGANAVGVVLGNELAAPADEEAVQPRQLRGGRTGDGVQLAADAPPVASAPAKPVQLAA